MRLTFYSAAWNADAV